MSVNGNIPVERSILPDGIAGVNATVKKMVSLAQGVYGAKSPKVRALAINILKAARVPPKDYYGELVAIHNWVRDNVRYTHDVVGQETLSTPEETLFNSLAEDCDGMVIAEMALLGSVGIESYPVVVGTAPNSYSHVYLYGIVPTSNGGRFSGKTIPLDPIMATWQAGQEAGPAMGIKAKKTYPELSNPLTNGLPMSGLTPRRPRRQRPPAQNIGDLGAYAVAPAYVDESEEAQANQICIPNSGRSYTHRDKTVANGVRAAVKPEGLDAMFSGLNGTADQTAASSYREAGGYLSSTSAGRNGTVVKSGGQLVPNGFIRNEPDIRQAMAMTPAPASRLGPGGPIFAQRASESIDPIAARANQTGSDALTKDPIVYGGTVHRNVGRKRYELPGVQQALRSHGGMSPNPVALDTKKSVVVLKSMPLDRIGAAAAPAKSLSGQLADAEAELAQVIPQAQHAMAKASQPQALHYARNFQLAGLQLTKRAKTLEGNILRMRQQLRDNAMRPNRRNSVRSAAVTNGQQSVIRRNQMTFSATPPPGSVNGLGAYPAIPVRGDSRVPSSAFQRAMDARNARTLPVPVTRPVQLGDISLTSPIVWGPLVAFVGVFALMKLRKRSASPAA